MSLFIVLGIDRKTPGTHRDTPFALSRCAQRRRPLVVRHKQPANHHQHTRCMAMAIGYSTGSVPAFLPSRLAAQSLSIRPGTICVHLDQGDALAVVVVAESLAGIDSSKRSVRCPMDAGRSFQNFGRRINACVMSVS
jgi:hypothetical protein